MKAVILAAGEGVRMHPLTHSRPKVMLPLANKPILEHLLIELRKIGIQEFTFVVGYREDTIRNYFEDGQQWGTQITYVTQKEQLGTAHALKMARANMGDRFLLLNGDVLIKENHLQQFKSKTCISLCLFATEHTHGMGVVSIEGNRITHIHEKTNNPPSNLVNAGVYLLTPRIFEAIDQTRKSTRGEYEITDSLQLLINQGEEISYQLIDKWMDVGYPWELINANENMLEDLEAQNLGKISGNVFLDGPVSVGKGTVIKPGTYIEGPVIIGENCKIGPNSYIRPKTSIGHRCHIGASVEIKNSIIMNGAHVPHHNYVGDSIIGENCNLGSGTKVANLRLDKKTITVKGIDTKRRKLGVIMGDNVQTGINASINIGTLIGDNSLIGPNVIASGVIPPNSRILRPPRR